MGTSFDLIQVANTDAARAVAIPSPVLAGAGAEILVKDTSGAAGTNAITVTPVAGLIDGAASYDVASDSGFVMLRSDGVSWLVIGTSEVSGGGGGVATSVANVGQVTVAATGAGNDVTITAADDVFINPTDRLSTAGASQVHNPSGTNQVNAGTTLTLRAGNTGGVGDLGIHAGSDGGNMTIDAEAGSVTVFPGTSFGVVTAAGGITLSATGGNVNAASQDGDAQIASGVGACIVRCAADGGVVIGLDPLKLISEYDGAGAAQAAAIVNASGGAVIDSQCRTAVNALLAYFRLRGTVHA